MCGLALINLPYQYCHFFQKKRDKWQMTKYKKNNNTYHTYFLNHWLYPCSRPDSYNFHCHISALSHAQKKKKKKFIWSIYNLYKVFFIIIITIKRSTIEKVIPSVSKSPFQEIPWNPRTKIKGFPHGIGIQTLNSPNLTPVQDDPDQENSKYIKKSDMKKKERKRN
jgi:hypothetical protein